MKYLLALGFFYQRTNHTDIDSLPFWLYLYGFDFRYRTKLAMDKVAKDAKVVSTYVLDNNISWELAE